MVKAEVSVLVQVENPCQYTYSFFYAMQPLCAESLSKKIKMVKVRYPNDGYTNILPQSYCQWLWVDPVSTSLAIFSQPDSPVYCDTVKHVHFCYLMLISLSVG